MVGFCEECLKYTVNQILKRLLRFYWTQLILPFRGNVGFAVILTISLEDITWKVSESWLSPVSELLETSSPSAFSSQEKL